MALNKYSSLDKQRKLSIFEKDISNERILSRKVEHLFRNELDEIINDILILKEDHFLNHIKNGVLLELEDRYSEECFSNKKLNKIVNNSLDQIKTEYEDNYSLLIKTLENNSENSFRKRSNNKIETVGFRKHCIKDDDFPSHNCEKGGKFILVKSQNNKIKFLICSSCRKVYYSSFILCKCHNCNIDYYTNILDKNEDPNVLPATWENYHCQQIISEKMKCIKCFETFYLDMKTGMLKCINKKCNFSINPTRIIWTCSVCKEDFKSGGIPYNPLEILVLKKVIRSALILQQRAHPNKIPCCKLNVYYTDFYHKKSCKGFLYFGEYNNDVVIICEKCKTTNYSDRFIWTCPRCGKKFRDNENCFYENLNEEQDNGDLFQSSDEENENNSFSSENDNEENTEKKQKNYQPLSYREKKKFITINQEEKKSKYNSFKAETNDENDDISGNCKSSRNMVSMNKIPKPLKQNLKGLINNGDKSDDDGENRNRKLFRRFKSQKVEDEKDDKEIQELKKEEAEKDKEREKQTKMLILRKERREQREKERKEREKERQEEEKLRREREEEEERQRERERKEKEKRRQEEERIKKEKEKEEEEEEEEENNKNAKKNRIYNFRNRNRFRTNNTQNDINIPQTEKANNNKTPQQIVSNYNYSNRRKYWFSNKRQNEENPNNQTNDENKNKRSNFSESLKPIKTDPNIEKKEEIEIKNKKIMQKKQEDKNTCGKVTFEDTISTDSKSINNSNKINNNINASASNILGISDNLMSHLNKRIQFILEKYKLPIINVEDYIICQRIGEGSYGIIFSVIDRKDQKKYALKKIISNALKQIDTYTKEFELVHLCDHKNIMKVYGICIRILDTTTYALYVLMELSEGDWDQEIKRKLKQKKNYSECELINILYQLTNALLFMQEKLHISHRDIKPQNILIFPGNRYKLADFGEAKEAKISKQINTLRGTELFMSPALYDGLKHQKDDVNHNPFLSDVFSLGYCFLYASALNFNLLYEVRDICDDKSISVILHKCLQKIYSEKFISILAGMLEIDESRRLTFPKIIQLIKRNYRNEIEI